MLRIAVPNKGMLSEPAWNMLAEAGYRLRSNPRQLVVEDPDNDVELFYLRPLDIAVYVGRGTIDVGITGHDLLVNSGTDAEEHMQASEPPRSVSQPRTIRRLPSLRILKASESPPHSTSSYTTIWSSMASTRKPCTLTAPSNRPSSLASPI